MRISGLLGFISNSQLPYVIQCQMVPSYPLKASNILVLISNSMSCGHLNQNICDCGGEARTHHQSHYYLQTIAFPGIVLGSHQTEETGSSCPSLS